MINYTLIPDERSLHESMANVFRCPGTFVLLRNTMSLFKVERRTGYGDIQQPQSLRESLLEVVALENLAQSMEYISPSLSLQRSFGP